MTWIASLRTSTRSPRSKEASDEADRWKKRAAELEGQASATPQIVLEKVAASAATLERTVDTLVSNGLVPAAQRTQVLSDLQTDPESIYKLAAKLAAISNHAYQEGAGIPKAAASTATASDPDGWGKVVREGA